MHKRVISGIQPTGNLHIGNYLGAVLQWLKLQKDHPECLFMIVDLHAITVWQDPQTLKQNIREVTAAILASGIDHERSIVFPQSAVSSHAEMAWIMNCTTRIGWLNRMTQFKDKAGKNKEKASLGLYAYPCLMAADILTYKATHIPVGEDQKQHLELTRDIAQKFNSDYGVDFFPIVEPVITGPATRVMSLRDGNKKMSKSDESAYSRIHLTDDADMIALKIRKAKTDPQELPETYEELVDRPEAKNLINIYAAISGKSKQEVCTKFAGQSFSIFKPAMADLLVEHIAPISQKMRDLLAHPDEIDSILRKGAQRANIISKPILKETYDLVGFIS